MLSIFSSYFGVYGLLLLSFLLSSLHPQLQLFHRVSTGAFLGVTNFISQIFVLHIVRLLILLLARERLCKCVYLSTILCTASNVAMCQYSTFSLSAATLLHISTLSYATMKHSLMLLHRCTCGINFRTNALCASHLHIVIVLVSVDCWVFSVRLLLIAWQLSPALIFLSLFCCGLLHCNFVFVAIIFVLDFVSVTYL